VITVPTLLTILEIFTAYTIIFAIVKVIYRKFNFELGIVIGAVVTVFFIELGYLWGGQTDYALQIAYYHIGGSWFPMPYGVLWTWLNPLYWTDVPYKAYLTGVVIGIGILESYLVKRGKIPLAVLLANQCQNVIWFLVTGYQHITTTAFQALSFWNPLFMIGWVFQEFPIGNPAGWDCDFGKPTLFYTLNNAQWQLCGPGDLVLGRLLWHLMEAVWVIVPMVYWGVKGWRYLRARN
jgi:hypothetical protein